MKTGAQDTDTKVTPEPAGIKNPVGKKPLGKGDPGSGHPETALGWAMHHHSLLSIYTTQKQHHITIITFRLRSQKQRP